jgi:hypothetical protein
MTFDLSSFKGQHIRLVFLNRNLWPASWGIWSYVDDVRVLDAGPLPPPGSNHVYLPGIANQRCDAVISRTYSSQNALIRPPTP